MAESAQPEDSLKQQFVLFTRGNKAISFTQMFKWFKQAEIFGEISSKDLENKFNKISCRKADYETFLEFIKSIFNKPCLNQTYDDYVQKLISCGNPKPFKLKHVVKVRRKSKEQNTT